MTQSLVLHQTQLITAFPAKNGISSHYSPYTILTKQHYDYKKHCQFEFGTYVQAFQQNEPSNTNKARTIDGIYLRPIIRSIQGGHEVLDLATGKDIITGQVTPVALTEHIKSRVELMAAKQGIKSLKIEYHRTEAPLLPADWIAGVDYQDEIRRCLLQRRQGLRIRRR